jgi:hypothetical protein
VNFPNPQRDYRPGGGARSLRLVLTAVLLLALASSGCSSQSGSSRPSERGSNAAGAKPATQTGTLYSTADADYDYDDEHPPAHAGFDDEPLLRQYGRRAGHATARAVATVVGQYYAAALAADGTRACALLAAVLAEGVAAEAGQNPQSDRTGCAAKLAPQLAQQHSRIASEEPGAMRVKAVYAKEDIALAVLSLRAAPESEIVLAREGGSWKIDALFASYMR